MKGQPFRAWQPLTFGGVASYGFDWVGRLFVTGVVFSLIATAAVVFTARRALIPVVDTAVTQLPSGAEIGGGKFTAPRALRLAENSFVSVRLDPQGEFASRSTADFEMTLGPTQFRAQSILGVAAAAYPLEWTIHLNRTEMEPWWGAWRSWTYGLLGTGTVLFLFVSWVGLAIPYAIIARISAWIAKRRISLWGSWKLSVAALMPGALLFSFGIFLYGASQIRLMELIGIWVAHFVVGWIFLAGGIYALPKKERVVNPFEPSEPEEKVEDETEPAKEANPFRKNKK